MTLVLQGRYRPIALTNPPTFEIVCALIRKKTDTIALFFSREDSLDAGCAGMVVKVLDISPTVIPQSEAEAHPFSLNCLTTDNVPGICRVDLKENTATWQHVKDHPKWQ